MIKVYNSKYNLDIEIASNEAIPIFINHDTKEVYKPFLKHTNTKLVYPLININNELVYCHKIIAYSFLSKKEYNACFKRLLKQGGRYIVVDHKNGNTLDYRPQNLRYLTNSDNIKINIDYMQPLNEQQYKELKLWRFENKHYKIKQLNKNSI